MRRREERNPIYANFVPTPFDLTQQPPMRRALKRRYGEAVKSLMDGASPLQRDVLSALAYAPDSGISSIQLAQLLGQRDKVVVNGAFGRLGRALWNAVREHPDGYNKGEFEWWTMLATAEYDGAEFRWILRPEVLAAIAPELSQSRSTDYKARDLMEGRAVTSQVDIFERNPIARRQCLQAHGYECAACDTRLADVYGEIAADFIHVHHLRPLRSDGGEHIVDPVRDLRPVCPNCHAIIHRRTTPLEIDEVRELLRNQRNRRRVRKRRLPG